MFGIVKKVEGLIESINKYIEQNGKLVEKMKEYIDTNNSVSDHRLSTFNRDLMSCSGSFSTIDAIVSLLKEDYFTGQYVNEDRAKILYVIEGGSIEKKHFIGEGSDKIIEKGGCYYLFVSDKSE